MRGRGLAGAVMVSCCALGIAGAAAQISPFRAGPNAPRLGAGDMDMIWRSADALNADPAAQPGASRAWHNPRTQDSGTVTLQRRFVRQGLPCHALHYTVSVRTEPTPRRYDVIWCRTQAGAWKIAN